MDDLTFSARRASAAATATTGRAGPRDAVSHAGAVAAARRHAALPERPARRELRRRIADADVRPAAAGRRELRRASSSTSASRGSCPATPPRYMAERPANEAIGRAARQLPRTARRGQHRGPVAVGPALPRDDRPRREDADRLRVDPHRRQVGHLGADPRADRIGQGSRRADDSRAEPPERGASSRRSTARRCPTRCSSRKSSATKKARSPARTIASRDGSSWPTKARCSSTRSATCRSSRRPSCCACSRSGASSASAATSRSRSTSG